MTRTFRETDAMRERRLAAGDPGASVWVSANAGSGKTHVLTQRVLRLLLAGVAPERLLCLTYTKAAAAEMRGRVSEKLSGWALMGNKALDADLRDLADATPDDAMRARARTLFARALDTPGGLKINTIHAFCESVLHRFPMEAGVPFDFAVVEDDERQAMIASAREAVLAEGLDGAEALAEASGALFALASDTMIAGALDAALASGAKLRLLLADPARALANLRERLGLKPADTLESIDHEIVDGAIIVPGKYQELAQIGVPDGLAKKLLAFTGGAEAMLDTFLTQKLEAPKNLNVTKAFSNADPALAEQVAQETERLAALAERRAAARIFATSQALLILLGEILMRYERAKRARSLVDFDDLIHRLRLLLENSEAAWVAYKLDAQIDHILVDESQDTNPEQWAVVKALADEFFAGRGADRAVRTLFAVGDEKQSIFSFQGAESHLFAAMGDWVRQAAWDAELVQADVELKASFRSLPEILEAVDLVFENPAAHRGLERQPQKTAHEAARREKGGFVELWTPLKKEKSTPLEGDAYPIEPVDEARVERELARRIAKTVSGWITSGRRLAGSDRAVAPGDFLILVQKRSPVFHEIIAALKREGLPNAGADRLSVTGHIAVRDLMVLGDVMLNISDELGLATVLRSPLIGLSEAELEALCLDRTRPLWEELAVRSEPWAKAAHEKLAGWRGRLDLDRPYDFFANILFAGGGLKLMHRRLGAEIDDVIAEFLDLALAHEQEAQPSMQGFLAGLRQDGHTVKRELAGREGLVRVMSVHGAKGLEAPIVILADAAAKPSGPALTNTIFLKADREDARQRFLMFPAGALPDIAVRDLKAAAREAEYEEYHRRLYVAMTRAESELYVTGILPVKESSMDEPSWFDLIEAGLDDQLSAVDEAGVRRFPAKAATSRAASEKVAVGSLELPDWIAPLDAPARIGLLSPSEAGEDLPRLSGGGIADQARIKGIAIHALLQFLPRFPKGERAARGMNALAAYLPEEANLRGQVLERALRLIDDPGLGDIFFGPGSRAEVPVVAEVHRNGTLERIVGRIDRLISGPPIRIIDFKSDAAPPAQGSPVPPAYLAQLALYREGLRKIFPGQVVEAAILWTETGHLARIDAETLDRAAMPFTSP